MSILEFDDGIGGRLRGTLHAPGATPGDVLTVGVTRGAISPSPGGGSQPILHVVTVGFADIQADPFGDGNPGAPLLTAPVGSLTEVIGAYTTEAFNDSGPGNSADSLQVVDGADSFSFGFLKSDPSTAPNPAFSGSSGLVTWGQTGPGEVYYAVTATPLWGYFGGFSLDGTAGSIDFVLRVTTSA